MGRSGQECTHETFWLLMARLSAIPFINDSADEDLVFSRAEKDFDDQGLRERVNKSNTTPTLSIQTWVKQLAVPESPASARWVQDSELPPGSFYGAC
jgi:hypothetical protein